MAKNSARFGFVSLLIATGCSSGSPSGFQTDMGADLYSQAPHPDLLTSPPDLAATSTGKLRRVKTTSVTPPAGDFDLFGLVASTADPSGQETVLFLYDDLKKKQCAKAALYTPLGDPIPCPHCDQCIPNTPQAHTLIGTVGGQYLLKSWTDHWPAPYEHFVTRLDFLGRPIPGASQAGEVEVLVSAADGDYGAWVENDNTTDTARYHIYRIEPNASLTPWRPPFAIAQRDHADVSAIQSLGNAIVVGTSYNTATTWEVELLYHNGENFRRLPIYSEPQTTCIYPTCQPPHGVNGIFTVEIGSKQYLAVWWSESHTNNVVVHLRFLTMDGTLVRDVPLAPGIIHSLVQTTRGEWVMSVRDQGADELILKVLSPIDPQTGAGGDETELDRSPGIGGPRALAVTKNGVVWLHSPWGSPHDAAGKLASFYQY